MAIKKSKEVKKKKVGERGKSKPIENIKSKPIKEKVNRVKELEKELPNEDSKKTKNSMGRPPVITETILQKLKLCFAVGMTDEQACYFCGISTTSFYEYQKNNPDFKEEKNILKESITMQARVNVGRSIKSGNVTDSWKWLEKKDASFTPKLKFEGEIKQDFSEEDEVMYERILNGNLIGGKKEIKNG